MSHFGASRVRELLLVSALPMAPALAQAQATPAAADAPPAAPQQQKIPAPASTPTPASVAPAAAPQAPSTSGTNPSSEYAGAEACQACHADIYTGWEKSAHWKQTYKEGGIAKHGCEDCHGAAASHVADPTDTSKLFLFEKASAKKLTGAAWDATRAARST
jgi:hypothetical protein